MSQNCFVCDSRIGLTPRNAINIFNETISKETTVASLLSLVLERSVSKDNVHSQCICKKCHKLCIEYQMMHLKIRDTKLELQTHFRKTLLKVSSAKASAAAATPVEVKSENKPMARLVLPASSLQPLPANYVIDVNKLHKSPVLPKMVTISSSHFLPSHMPRFQTPVRIAPYPLQKSLTRNVYTAVTSTPQTIKISEINEVTSSYTTASVTSDTFTECKDKTIETTIATTLMNKPTSILNFVNTLPKNFLASDKSQMKPEGDLSDDFDNDDQENAMEIDEDSSNFVRIPAAETDLMIDESRDKDSESLSPSYRTVENLSSNSKAIVSKVKVISPPYKDDNHQEQRTIVMEDENGSILEMMSGKKLMYSSGNLSLLMPSDQEDNDSNEETQIELQISGDDDTAEFILATAKEEGGALIKLETGERFHVNSVNTYTTNSPEAEEESETPLLEMVKEENGRFTCLLCHNLPKVQNKKREPVEADAENMMLHLKEKHGARLYICWVCNRVMRRRADLSRHLDTHEATKVSFSVDKTKQFSCRICHKKYNSNTLLQEHLNVHNGRRPYVCPVCSKSFASKYTHQAHLKTHSDRPRPFKCKKCPKAFLTQQNLTQHEKTHLGIKDFVCNVCNKAFATQHNLEVHRVVHLGTKPYKCDTCGKGFARKNEVKDHVRIHTGERPFACEVCGAAFSQRSNLATHIRATHLNVALHKCTQCPKRFKRRRLLEYHLKASHTGERPLVCEICNSTFVYPEHYRKHQRIHSGEKPYDCEVCGKTFNSRDNRNTHRFVHSDKKPYECLVCGAGYMRKQLLYAHMNASGHMAESIVVNQPRVQKFNTREKIATASIMENSNSQDEQLVFESKNVGIVDNRVHKTAEDDEVDKIYVTNAADDAEYVLQDGKSVINLEVDGDETTLLSFLNNMDPTGEKAEQPTGQPVQIVSSEECPDVPGLRLVQVQMQDGATGWVALGQ